MTNKKNHEVCIIGAGIGGLTTGVLLSKHGFNVKIFEKESLIGGRALTLDMSTLSYDNYEEVLHKFHMCIPFSEPPLASIFEKKMLHGYHLDLGFHVFGGEITSNIKQVIPDADIEMIESKLFASAYGNPYLFATTFDKMKMLPNLLRLFLAGQQKIKELENTPIKHTKEKYAKGKTKLVLELSSRLITTVNNLDVISTGEVFHTQQQMRLRGVRYPKKGIARICKALADDIHKHGGEIYLNTPVEKILIKDKKAVGVAAGKDQISCDYVISTMLVQNLFTIADERQFPREYVKEIKNLKGTGSLCAYYSLKHVDSRVLGKNFVFIERDVGLDGTDVAGMVDFMASLPDSHLAPPNEYLVQAYVICSPDEAQDTKTLEKLKKILDKQLENIIPDFRKHLRWAIYPAIWHLDGVAKTIENKKPDIETPVDRLYLAGDCVKAPGIGVNCAMNSAQMLSAMLTEGSPEK